MDLPVGPREPVELARDECPKLLALESPGWLAVRVAPAALDVVPVNYVMRGDAAVIRTHAGDPGPHQILVRVTPSTISGRRLELHQQSLDAAGCL